MAIRLESKRCLQKLSDEIQALVDDLGLVPSDSPQGVAISRYGSKPRFCELYKRAKAKEAKEFQERFHQRFKKYSRVDHGACQIDAVVLPGLFEYVHVPD